MKQTKTQLSDNPAVRFSVVSICVGIMLAYFITCFVEIEELKEQKKKERINKKMLRGKRNEKTKQ